MNEGLSDYELTELRRTLADALRALDAHPSDDERRAAAAELREVADLLADAHALGVEQDADDRAAFEASLRATKRGDA